MKNIKNEGKNVAEVSPEALMKRLLVFGAAGLKLGRQILAKVEDLEDSVEILAQQKARELNPEKSPDAKGN